MRLLQAKLVLVHPVSPLRERLRPHHSLHQVSSGLASHVLLGFLKVIWAYRNKKVGSLKLAHDNQNYSGLFVGDPYGIYL